MQLEDKIVVVTGGGNGLGRESALLFAREGARVVVGDIDGDRIAETIASAQNEGLPISGQVCDVSREDDVARLVQRAIDEHERLDVMFNNAGIPVPGNGKIALEEITDEQWQRQIGVNLSGVFYGIKHAAVAMKRDRRGGVILNTSSASGHVAFPGWAIYAAAKAGVVGLTRGAAVDLGKYGIRVNVMTPLGGMSASFVKPAGTGHVGAYEEQGDWDPAANAMPLKLPRPPGIADHARLALFLISDGSAYISGQAISLDGAQLARVGWQPAPVAEGFAGTPEPALENVTSA